MGKTIRIMNGLGDTIYHRPFVIEYLHHHNLTLDTKYPELFSDLEVEFSSLDHPDIAPTYNTKDLRFRNILGNIGRFFPPLATNVDFTFNLPKFPRFLDHPKYAVIRPPTLRKDFYGPARLPRMEYIREATQILKSLGYATVGVAALKKDEEWLDGDPPEFCYDWMNGERTIPELMSLIEHASVVVGGPGWQVPAAWAYRTNTLILYGGAGKINRYSTLYDPRINFNRTAWVEPDHFCMCENIKHDCNKAISDFDEKFQMALWSMTHG